MERTVTAVYDANTLYPAPQRAPFIQLAQPGGMRPFVGKRGRSSVKDITDTKYHSPWCPGLPTMPPFPAAGLLFRRPARARSFRPAGCYNPLRERYRIHPEAAVAVVARSEATGNAALFRD